jgi:Co/Zn/Cd efflux system component
MTKLQQNPLREVTIRVLLLIVLVDAVLYLVLKDDSLKYIAGASIGIFVSLVGFHLLNRSLNKSLEASETKAALLHRRDQMLRNLMYMAVLVVTIKISWIDPFATAIGLLGVRVIIQSDSVINWFIKYYKKEV